MKKNRKIILLLIAVFIITGFTIYQTSAFGSIESIFTGTVSIGKVKTELIEKQMGQDGQLEDLDNDLSIVPGSEISRIVSVKNIGTADAYVRVELIMEINSDADLAKQMIEIMDLDTENWTQKEGYYYYNQPLAVGETTTVLFTGMSFSTELGNEIADSTIKIVVEAQATQVANNGENPLDAKGWPK